MLYTKLLDSDRAPMPSRSGLFWYQWEKLWYQDDGLSPRIGLIHALPHVKLNSQEECKWVRALFEIVVTYAKRLERLRRDLDASTAAYTIMKTALDVLGQHLFSSLATTEKLACRSNDSARDCVFWFFREHKSVLLLCGDDQRLQKQVDTFVEAFGISLWRYGSGAWSLKYLPEVIDLFHTYNLLTKLLPDEKYRSTSWKLFTLECRERLYELACGSDRPDPKTYKKALARGSQAAQVLALARAALRT